METQDMTITNESSAVLGPVSGIPVINGGAKRKRAVKMLSTLAAAAVFLCFLMAVRTVSPPKPEVLRNEPPKCEVLPIISYNDIGGVLYFTNAEKIESATMYVREKTQQRVLYEEELPIDEIRSGSYTIPTMSFFHDYAVHFEEYTGYEGKGDYNQEILVRISYDSGNEGIKTRTFSRDPVEAYLCWLQKASRSHGAKLVQPGYITEIVHTPAKGVKVAQCLIEQPDLVRRVDTISVRVTIDGETLKNRPHSELVHNGLMIVRIPIPEGMAEDGSHTIEIYVTQYILGFKKTIEFEIHDTF